MDAPNILIIDNEQEIRQIVKLHLAHAGMQVCEADSGRRALDVMARQQVDLIVLDLMMEDMDGWAFLDRLRSEGATVPVLVLSARGMEADKIETLGLGADDYMTKPFGTGELLARIRAILRRVQPAMGVKRFRLGEAIFDVEGQYIQKPTETVALSPLEAALLELFCQHPRKVFTHQEIFRQVWKIDHFDRNSVKVYVNFLRKKLEDNPAEPRYIQTIRGVGYRLCEHGS